MLRRTYNTVAGRSKQPITAFDESSPPLPAAFVAFCETQVRWAVLARQQHAVRAAASPANLLRKAA